MSVRNYTPGEIWNLIVRNRWLLLIPVAIGVAAAPLLSRFAPLRYRSDALILVVPQQVPENYVQPTIVQSVEDRLPSITAQILSRSKLEKIILEMDLYKAERSRQVMEDVVETMRSSHIRTTAGGQNVDSFSISYISDDPETARRVTERLTSLYIEQNVTDRANQAEQTSQFLGSELKNLEERLKESEKKLETYRKAHSGQLPSQLPSNLQAQANAQMAWQALNEATNRALERRIRVERDIAALDAIPLAPSTPDGPAPLTTAQRLELERAQLTALLQKVTPGHPDVANAQRRIAELTQRLDSETPLSATRNEKPLSLAEAAQQRRRLDLQNDLAVIDAELSTNRAEQARLKREIAQYQAKVDVVPTRESELVEMTREYSTLSAAYNELVMKREGAAIAAKMETNAIGEQFKILDGASFPEKPFNQLQRAGILSSGAAVGLLLGLIVLGFREYSDSSFRSKDEVVKALSLPVLASIPVLASTRERQAAVRRMRFMDVGGSVVLLGAVATLVAWRLFS